MMRHIPNFLTLINLCAGVFALIHSSITLAIYCLCVSLIADILDGAAARALNASSPIGNVLDSLADMVAFVAMPAVLTCRQFGGGNENLPVLLAALFFVSMGALRLARFSSTEDHGIDFKGMPVPASAVGIAIAWHFIPFIDDNMLLMYVMTAAFIFFGLLNVAPVTMLSQKKLGSSRLKQIFFAMIGVITITTVLALGFPQGLLAGMGSYIVLSLVAHSRQSSLYS